jgi:hypothetical protein
MKSKSILCLAAAMGGSFALSQSLARVPTTMTGLWYEKRGRFYLAVPAGSKPGAALWVYAAEDCAGVMNRFSSMDWLV